VTAPAADPAAVGERIERLLEASAAGGPVAHERAEELVRLVVGLYGAGLERLLEIAHETGRLDDVLLDALADDPLVSSLLLVHDLHPDGVQRRVEKALEGVRPYLGSHGGDVKLLDVSAEGVVTLQLLGSCDGCASSAVTLELAVEDAIRAAAPEVVSIEVSQPPKGLIPVDALSVRLHPTEEVGVVWSAAGSVDALAPGEMLRTTVEGTPVLVARLLSGCYAYQDRCAACSAAFDGAVLAPSPALPGSAVLRCRSCGAQYDVRRAGADLDVADRHLEPVPLLERDGVLEVAVRAAAVA
jgi:Fe-S cluster biogenesis protein NfuA/nitrite reductase/ring-hydroxylating ferredoxin subunit